MRSALFVLAAAAAPATLAASSTLTWLSQPEAWSLEQLGLVPRESFVGWLRARAERARAADAAEAYRAAVAARHAAAGLDALWRDAIVARAATLSGDDVEFKSVRDRSVRLQDAYAVLRTARRGSITDRDVVAVATDFILARDGRSFVVQILAGYRAANTDHPGKAVAANYRSVRVAEPAALLAPGVLEAELRQAAAFAAEVALRKVEVGTVGGRRVSESFDGAFLSEPAP